MKVSIIGKHIDVPPPLKEHIEQKVDKLDKYHVKVLEAQMVLKQEKYLYIAELKLNAKGLKMYAEERDETNLYSAVDKVVQKMEMQLVRRKEKMKGHHKGEISPRALSEAAAENREEPLSRRSKRIVKRENFFVRLMTVDEASAQLDQSDDMFLIFSNVDTGKMSILYKRKDNSYGLIEPEL